ncbi:cysteine desulfurase-like protein [Leptolyngbya sp. FACHB-711]|uniref:cysteine desulfurase-like protein n=1 Tax=unclassified Leptolyngbya TaxID=2650499 RepID=UPI0016861227|nr:cysteine desulfurase-like protein [Leptolyngbya sp. FACHB-711]MBD1852714.1 cysteine desulfurase-like protein [Cyanobacteria bacterium FACHB-502]MBD2026577.1 cysteine desulfurase-like protein [Leptolyngbya sp. FACHB-711]
MTVLDLSWIRAQFPALRQQINGHPVLFLDGPGGTQVPQRVIDAITNYLLTANANQHGAFATSVYTDALVNQARAAVADFLGCDAGEVVFGANMTTLTFAISRAIGRLLQAGDEIVVTQLDHDANVSPWLALKERGVIVRTANIHLEDCTLDLVDLERQITPRTKLVAIGYASNAVGTINNVAQIIKLAHAVGAATFVDAVHYAPHGLINVRSLDCDFLVCSAYKFFGPHVGILYGKREHLARLYPYKVLPAPNEVPCRWETGTLNFEGLAGVVACIDYLAELGRRIISTATDRRQALMTAMVAIQEYERSLSDSLIPHLLEIPGLTLYGIQNPAHFVWRTPTIAFRLAGYSPAELAGALGDRGIFAWHGHFYALNLIQHLGLEARGGLLRIGCTHYNTPEEIYRLLHTLHELAVHPVAA